MKLLIQPGEQMEVGTIGNYYGCLEIKESGGKYYWSIENYDGHDWEEIPKSLYKQLREFERKRDED